MANVSLRWLGVAVASGYSNPFLLSDKNATIVRMKDIQVKKLIEAEKKPLPENKQHTP